MQKGSATCFVQGSDQFRLHATQFTMPGVMIHRDVQNPLFESYNFRVCCQGRTNFDLPQNLPHRGIKPRKVTQLPQNHGQHFGNRAHRRSSFTCGSFQGNQRQTTTVWDISSTSKNAFCKQETLIERNFLLAIEVGTEFR
jgi:hypothetical protein